MSKHSTSSLGNLDQKRAFRGSINIAFKVQLGLNPNYIASISCLMGSPFFKKKKSIISTSFSGRRVDILDIASQSVVPLVSNGIVAVDMILSRSTHCPIWATGALWLYWGINGGQATWWETEGPFSSFIADVISCSSIWGDGSFSHLSTNWNYFSLC